MALYKQGCEKGLSHLFFKRRLHDKKAIELLAPKKDDKILDIGCGSGELIEKLRTYTGLVVGIDINEELIKSSGVEGLKVMSAEILEFEDRFFDKVVSIHTIEHIPNLKKVFREIERVLRKQGTCVLLYPFEAFRGANIFLKSLFTYGNPFVARRLHVHKLSPEKIASLTNLDIIKRGVFFAPYPTYFTVFQNKG